MSLDVEATYENGVLKPDKPLPLGEHQRVRVRIESSIGSIRQSAGLVPAPSQPAALAYLLGPENLP